MANNEKSKNICSSVFKSGENTTTKSQFTQKWIELINKLEKNKGITAAQHNDKLPLLWYNSIRGSLFYL